jgi:hypothetical protein
MQALREHHRPRGEPDAAVVVIRRCTYAICASFVLALFPTTGTAHTKADEARVLRSLAALTTAAPLSMSGYSRDEFPHWRDPDGNGCNARQDTLRHDGTRVVVGAGCRIVSGRWVDRYSGTVYRVARSLDCDHLVPLADAWRSGARRWSDERRERYANDPVVLVMTSAHLNRQKGDSDPSEWVPPRRAYWFTYAKRWVRIKARYHLAVTRAERKALRAMVTG